MISYHLIEIRKPVIARTLLLIFAFSAWSLTSLANLTLALLILLFLTDIPSHREQLRRDPAFLLLIGVVLTTSLLALRAGWDFPSTVPDQLHGIKAWASPFLFVIIAWWLRRDPSLSWTLMGSAILGLVFGVLRKTDWSLIPRVLDGMRYDFGYAALGLAFIASVMLMGLFVFHGRFIRMRLSGRPRPWLGWLLWISGVAFLLVLLLVTQSRGAALSLAIAAVLYVIIQTGDALRRGNQWRRQAWRALVSAALIVTLAVLLLWATKERQVHDWQELTVGSESELSYSGSVATRLNLWKLGTQVFAERPLLGFGPGTSSTEFLVPQRIVSVDDYQFANAPHWSHLHSVALEVVTRFGLAGLLIAALLLAILLRTHLLLNSDPRVPDDLRVFLILGSVMLLLYCLYDFRLVNVDIRFFCILFLGIAYSFHLERPVDAGKRYD